MSRTETEGETVDYQANLRSLCKQNHAQMIPDAAGSGGAWSDSTTGELHIPPTLSTEDTYWTALHELGHIVHKDSQAKQTWFEQHPPSFESILFGTIPEDDFPLTDLQRQEALATTWALDHGGFDPSPVAAANILFSLHTYNTCDEKTGVGDVRAPNPHPPAEYTACEKRLEALAKGVKPTMTNERVRAENS